MPVTISIILDQSQIDVGSLVQVERYERAPRRIQENIMCTRTTLDWSQSNNFLNCLHAAEPQVSSVTTTAHMLSYESVSASIPLGLAGMC